MLVKDVAEIARLSSLSNLAIAKSDSALINFIYLGTSELYRRFNLSIKIESVITNPNLAKYELRSEDVSLMLNLFNTKSRWTPLFSIWLTLHMDKKHSWFCFYLKTSSVINFP